MAEFDYEALWLEVASSEDPTAYLREQIEKAFVPAWHHKSVCFGYGMDVDEATARAEAAEAEVARLRDVVEKIATLFYPTHEEAIGAAQITLGETP